jgi:hypothetical protein
MEIASGSGGEVTPVLEEYFGYFQNCLKANDGEDARTVDWMHGQQLTYADIAVFGAVNYAVTIHKANMTLRGFGGLKEFHDKCAERTLLSRFADVSSFHSRHDGGARVLLHIARAPPSYLSGGGYSQSVVAFC